MPPNNTQPTQFPPKPMSSMPPRPTMPPMAGNTPPKMPTIQMNSGGEHYKFIKPLVSILVAVIVLGGAYYVFKNSKSSPKPASFSNEKVTVEKSKGLPDGFPTFIPVEVGALTDSSKLFYADRGVTLYSLTLKTSQQPEDLYNAYSNAIKTAKFNITKLDRSSSQTLIEASLNTSSILITILPQKVGAIVQIAYSEKK